MINLSPDKAAVFGEAFRVLMPGGRLAISDVVATGKMPAKLARDVEALTGCVAGAAPVAALRDHLRRAGFKDIRIDVSDSSRETIRDWFPGTGAEKYVASARIEATRQGR